MTINPTDYIRQQEFGQFRMPSDGKKPYVHANDQKVESTEEQKKSAVYTNDKNIDSFERGLRSDSLQLFDSSAGLEVKITKLDKHQIQLKKEEKSDQQDNKTGKSKITPTLANGENAMEIYEMNSKNSETQTMYQVAESKGNEAVDKTERTDTRQRQNEEVKPTTTGQDQVTISKEAQDLAQQHYSKQEDDVENEDDSSQPQTAQETIDLVV